MNHSFNIDLAQKFGVDGAIIIENLYFWIQKNKANKKHFYDGEYWTYNSVSAFSELFPYWTARQIERILKNLEKNGAIKIGNYNKLAYDRTKWYAITQTVKSIYANGEMDLQEKLNGNTQNVETIPDINPDINTDINTNNKVSKKGQDSFDKLIDDYTQDKELKETILEYIEMRINKKAKPTNKALELIFKKLDKFSTSAPEKIRILEQSILNNWTDIYQLKEEKKGVNNASKINSGDNKGTGETKGKWDEFGF